MIVRTIKRGEAMPRFYRVVEYRDFKNLLDVAPVGLHWLLKGWIAVYAQVQYKLALKLQADLLLSSRYDRSKLPPLAIEFLGDDLARQRGYGLCWEWEEKTHGIMYEKGTAPE
ncbi:MAG: hypothetical protein ACREO0_15110, partial [Pseudoxanthomonas sp.]